MAQFLFLLLPLVWTVAAAAEPKTGDSIPARRFPSALGLSLKNWKVEDAEGKSADLPALLREGADGDRKAKVGVLLFLSDRCPVTLAYAERIGLLTETYADKPVSIVGLSVNRGESLKSLGEFAERWNWGFPLYRDTRGKIAPGLRVHTTPWVLVFNGKGKVVYSGAIDNHWIDARKVTDASLKKAIDAVLAGTPVSSPEPGYFGGRSIR